MNKGDVDIKVVVTFSRDEFTRICRTMGLNPHRTKYINLRENIEKELSGYYRESIYPDYYADLRPTATESDSDITETMQASEQIRFAHLYPEDSDDDTTT